MLSAALVMLAALTTSFSVLLVMLLAVLSTMLPVCLAMALATHAALLTMGLSATTSRFRSESFNSCNCRLY